MSYSETTIQCPSCNRRIYIGLHPPLTEMFLPIDCVVSPRRKEYTLRDLLYVHDELIRENNRMRKHIDKLNMLMEKS